MRLEDPETHTAYVLFRAEEYDRLKPDVRCEEAQPNRIPEGISTVQMRHSIYLPQSLPKDLPLSRSGELASESSGLRDKIRYQPAEQCVETRADIAA